MTPILYVETNFLMAFAKGQERHGCLWADPASVQLVMPFFCVMESLSSLTRARSESNRFLGELERALREARRDKTSSHAQELAEALDQSILAATKLANQAEVRLHAILQVMADLTDLLQSSADSIRNYLGRELIPRLPDRLILSAILDDAARRPADRKAFLSANSRDFGKPDVQAALADLGVKFFTSTEHALGWLRATPRD